MASEEIDPQPHKYWPSVESLKRTGKKPTGDITICRLYQGLRFHTQREDGTNPTSIRPTKETGAAMTILYRNTKVKVRSPDGDTEYFDIVAGVLQGDTLAPYLFIICLDYVLRTSIDKIRENGFELTKKRSRRYPAKTITDADYADDIALLANTPNQAEALLHSLERAAAGIGLHVNALKIEYMLQPNRRHCHIRRNLSETSRQIHLPRKQRLINRKGHRHSTNESMDSYR